MQRYAGCRAALGVRASGSDILSGLRNVAALSGLLASLCGAVVPAARAQTAQFSYATATLGAGFSNPSGVAVDRSGDIFVADDGNNAVKEIVAVGGLIPASPTINTVGSGFTGPLSVAVDSGGNVFVGESDVADGYSVKEIVAGTGGAAAGTVNSSSTVISVGSGFDGLIYGVAVDAGGDVFVADTQNYQVKEIVAGTGGAAPGTVNSSSTVNLLRQFPVPGPFGVAVDSSGDVFVASNGNGEVNELVAGTGGAAPGTVNSSSTLLSLGSSGFNGPTGVALDASGNVFVSDFALKEIVASDGEVSSTSTVLTVASGFSSPFGLAVLASGNILVADAGNNAVTEVMPQGVNVGAVAVGSTGSATTLSFTFTSGGSGITPSVLTQGATGLDFTDAGTGTCTTNGTSYTYSSGDTCTVNVTLAPKYAGVRYGAVNLLNSSGNVIATAYIYGTGQAPQLVFPGNPVDQTLGAGFSYPFGVTVDASGNIYVADSNNGVMKEMPAGCSSSSCVNTLAGGFMIAFDNPFGVAVDGGGNIYFSDIGLYEIPAGCASTSCVAEWGKSTIAPFGLAVDGAGNLYIADATHSKVWEIPPGCTFDLSTCNPVALGSGFDKPHGVAVDASGNIYVADSSNNAIKEMSPGCASSSCVTTLGSGFSIPYGVAADASGNIYVADFGSGSVKEMPPGCASSTCVTTLASGVDPGGIALDGAGNIYISDQAGNSSVVELNLVTPPTLTFPSTNTGSKSGPETAVLRNIGNEPLSFPSEDTENPLVGPPFSLDASTTCPKVAPMSSAGSLAAGASCNLAVDFAPVQGGAASNNLILFDNNENVANAFQSIPLSGTGVAPTLITPTVTVTPAYSSITTLQSLEVTITVSGGSGNPTPTGGVGLSSGSYSSGPATTLSGGSATITIPAGSLAVGSDTLTALYLPDANSYYTYSSANGTAPVTVIQPIGTCTTANPNPNPNPESFAATGDFNGDCRSDILWQNTASGLVYTWLMNGTSILSQAGAETVPSSTGWVIQGVGDFNGDGMADILWQNTTTGEVYIWFMNGSTIQSQAAVASVPSSTGWVIKGVGDFNDDGKADILWQNTISGEVYLWLMNGSTITSQASPETVAPSSGWVIQGIGDFNGDGMADILWQNSISGEVYIWLMNGATMLNQASPETVAPSTGWVMQGVGDFDGNGTSDILWQNTSSGDVYIWLMNGTTILNQGDVETVAPSSGWVIQGIGDYDGSGRSSILWRNSVNGEVYMWLMNGFSITSQAGVETVDPSTDWQIFTLLSP